MAPEAFFNPQLIGREEEPLDEAIYGSVSACDIDLRKELYQNIVLSGGSTMFPGLKERLHKELSELVPENVEIRIVAPPERRYSVWIGGSILASLKTFQRLWISKKEFEDQGASVAKRTI